MTGNSITLCCIDTINHWLAVQALHLSTQRKKFAETIFITDRDDLGFGRWKIHRIKKLNGFNEVNRFVLKDLHHHINTDFALLVQYDGFIWKPELWRDEFLEYDYIGAPWPDCPSATAIGTGGFSLRSRRLLHALRDDKIRMLPGINEDLLIGRFYRRYLEAQHGIRFPPIEIAARFALESSNFHSESFGFHGLQYLAQMYAGDMADLLIDNLQPYCFLRKSGLALAATYLNFGREDVVIKFFKRVAKHYGYAEGLKILEAERQTPRIYEMYIRYWPHESAPVSVQETMAALSARKEPTPAKSEIAPPIDVGFSAAVPFGYRAPGPAIPPRLAVVCHLFYEDMTPQFQRYLRNIPFGFDLFISTNTPAKKAVIETFFTGWTNGAVEVTITQNRGRDIAPKLVEFRGIYDSYDYALHLHSKKSAHMDYLSGWCEFLLENLLGSAQIVNSVFDAFAHRPDLGIIASQHYEPMAHFVDWGKNFDKAAALAGRMGLTLSPEGDVDFPAGSMFWARTAALKPLLTLDLSFDDFDPEHGQLDGTLAHAIERLYFHACVCAGYRWIKIAHPRLFNRTRAIIAIDSPPGLDRFMRDYTLELGGPVRATAALKSAALLHGYLDPDITETIRVHGVQVEQTLTACIQSPLAVQHLLGGIRRVNQVLRQCRTQADWDLALSVLLQPDDGVPNTEAR